MVKNVTLFFFFFIVWPQQERGQFSNPQPTQVERTICSLPFPLLALGEVFLSRICFGQNIETVRWLVCSLDVQIPPDTLFMF